MLCPFLEFLGQGVMSLGEHVGRGVMSLAPYLGKCLFDLGKSLLFEVFYKWACQALFDYSLPNITIH